MKIRLLLFLFISSFASTTTSFAGFSSADIQISPISIVANAPGVTISPKTMEQWVLQTDLSYPQLEALGLKPGKIDDDVVRRISEIGDDSQSRRFVEYLDSTLSLSGERNSSSMISELTSTEPWETYRNANQLIYEAAAIGGFDKQWKDDLLASLNAAVIPGASSDQLAARARIRVKLLDARQSAVRRAKGYRVLADAIRREIQNREMVANIAMVVEIRSSQKQPTIAPVSEVTMDCKSTPSVKLLFLQRKRDCNDNICKIESIAEINKGADYTLVYQQLMNSGRTYLDDCVISTKFLVDGEEVKKELPGKYTSNTVLNQ